MIICQVAEAVLSLDESDYRMSGRSRLLPRVSKFQSFQRVSQLDYMLHFFYPPHGHQAGGPPDPDPLIPSLILDPFDPRQEAYRKLFRYQIDPELVDQIRSATNGGFVLGSENFQQKIAQMIGQRTWRGSPGRPVKSEEGEGQQEFEL